MRRPLLCAVLVLLAAGLVLAQDSNFPNGPQYLLTGSPLFARPISTPSTALEGPPLEVGASNATGVLIAGAETQTVLPPRAVDLPNINLFPIYYGYGRAPASVIEISFAEPSSELSVAELPPSISDTGVGRVMTTQALREQGHGVTLGEAASYEKLHARKATHAYTNADIDRLHGGN